MGADLEARDVDEYTPLIAAVHSRSRAIVRSDHQIILLGCTLIPFRFLLNQGVDVNARDIYGYTALFWSENFYDYKAISKMIKNHGGTM